MIAGAFHLLPQRIAVVGSGISGLTAAWLLAEQHDVTLFESEARLGGHTNTIDIECDGRRYAVDTGFIVYNERTYPNFTRLLAELGVETQASDMSFSVRSDRTGWEYSGSSLNGLFAQRQNAARPTFYRMLLDILRFNRRAPALLENDDHGLTLGAFAAAHRFSREFWENYLIPMGAAIWSAPPSRMYDFPARHFVQFCSNHGLLSLTGRPQWRTVTGGAARYIEAMRRSRPFDVRLSSPVQRLWRRADEVELATAGRHVERFDQVVLAVHAPQALAMLADPSGAEREVLSAFEYQRNEAVLHTDTAPLPRRRRAWASWNYHVPADSHSPATVTYLLNRLQRLDACETFCVTLNDESEINEARVLKRITYEHPIVTARSVAAQQRHAEISGTNRTHYCGAYWGYGFHEDGVKSAMAVVRQIAREPQVCRVASTKATSGIADLAR